MENLIKIFGPIIPTFFTNQDGISLSEVNRLQAENKQIADEYWAKMKEATSGIFVREISYVGSGGDSNTKAVKGLVVGVEEIQKYKEISDGNAVIASLMQALKIYQSIQKMLSCMDLSGFVGEQPKQPDFPEPASTGVSCLTSHFMELQNIDQMLDHLQPDAVKGLDLAFWQEANSLNARAAVLGKLISEGGSFFRKLISPVPNDSDNYVSQGVLVTQYKKAYDQPAIDELTALRDALSVEYNQLQSSLNGKKKQIKDTVRAFGLSQEKLYQIAFGQYQIKASSYSLEMEKIRSAAELLRQTASQELAALKIRT